MRHFLDTVQGSDVVEGINGRAQPTVQTEDLVFNESSEGEVIEEVGEVLPHVGVAILAEALVVEAVNLGDLAGFVVATENGDTLRIADLQANQKGYSLDGVIATVDIITCDETLGSNPFRTRLPTTPNGHAYPRPAGISPTHP